MKNSRLWELQDRFNNTGVAGVWHLSDKELKEAIFLIKEVISYFSARKDFLISSALRMELISMEDCLFYRENWP